MRRRHTPAIVRFDSREEPDVTSYAGPGTLITYSYLVSNTGGANLDITLADSRLGAVSCPNGELNSGASETCTANYTTTQADVTAGSISNTATVTGTGTCSAKAVSSLTIPAAGTAALTLVKSARATSYSAPGTLITYSYLVTNTGNEDLSAVSVTDPQPGLSAVSCPSGTLAQAASETCTATYTTTQADVDAGSILNTGTASGTPPTGPAVTAVSSLTIQAVDTPSVSVVKSANVANYSAPGTLIAYSYLVTNTGNVDLTSVSVTDPQANLSPVSCPSSTLAPAASETCTGTYSTTQADVDASSISNTGTANGTIPSGGVVTDTSSLNIPASDSPALSVVKSASVQNYSAPGVAITYSYLVTNTGNVDLTVSVTDPQPGLSAVSCPNPSLAPTASETCTASHTTTQADVDAGSISNIGTATGTPQTGSAVTATSSLTVPAIDAPALSLVKTANVGNYSAPNILITYSYLVTNTGNVGLNSVSVTDPHVGLSAISCSSPSLAPVASETCTATYTTTQADLDAGSISNTGTASGKPPSGSVVTATSTLNIPATVTAKLSLGITAGVTSYSAAGTPITYSYQVTNTGNVDLGVISIVDFRVAVNCPSNTLAPAATETCTGTYITTQANVDAGSITTNPNVTGLSSRGSSAFAFAFLTIQASDNPGISLLKTANVTSYSASGTPITYSYLVTNRGNVTLTAVSVTDTHVGLSPVTCPSASLAPAAFETCTATYTTTQADVDAGSISNIGTAHGTAPSALTVTNSSFLTIRGTSSPKVSLVKTASVTSYSAAGIPITYFYKVTNTGNVDLNSVSVTDPQLGLSAVSCPNASLAPGAFEMCTATYTTTQSDVDAGSISNTGTASGTTSNRPHSHSHIHTKHSGDCRSGNESGEDR